MTTKTFNARHGLSVGVGSISVVDANGNIIANTITIGSASINSSSFSGTSNNALYLGGQLPAYYTNASNLSTGTINELRLPTSGVTSGTYGNSSQLPVITVDSYGRITNVVSTAVAGVSGFEYAAANVTFTITTSAGSSYTATIASANSSTKGVVYVVDSVSNTDTLVAASANSVKTAYDAAVSAYSNAIFFANSAANNAYTNAVSTAATDAANKAANAYSNAVSYADIVANTAYTNAVSTAATDATNKAANAYSNAVSYANTAAGTAYSNATTFASNASNISSGTLSETILPYRMDQDVRTTDTVEFGNMTITGNLTVSGTTTYVNTTQLNVGDNIITLNADITGATAPTENAGIEINRGSSANVQFLWDETNDRWSTNGQPLSVASLIAAGAVSGITTLAAGNTTITGFANVSSTLQVGGLTTFNANVTLGAADHLILSSTSGISANGTYGSNGQVLTTNGTVTYWANSAAGGFTGKVVTSNTTIAKNESIVADSTSSTITVNLPSSATTGDIFIVHSLGGNTNIESSTLLIMDAGVGNGLLLEEGQSVWLQAVNSSAVDIVFALPGAGGGSVSSIAAGNGIATNTVGGDVTISVNSTYIATLTSNNANYLQTKTWEAPGSIGSTTANSGAFTTLFASANVNVDNGTLFVDAVNNRVGIGNTSPAGEALDVRGNIRVGGADAGPNYIAFRGTTGDGPGSYNHTYVGERIYSGTEASEMFVFKGNDQTASAPDGPDRIRMAAGEFRVDTYSTALSGDFNTVASNTTSLTNKFIVSGNGNVGIGNTTPTNLLSVGGTVAAGNTTITGFANVTSTLQVGGITTFSANVVLGSSGLSANGGFGTAGHVLHSNGSAVYWDIDNNDNTTYDLLAVANTEVNAGRIRLKDSSNANDDVIISGAGTTTVSSNATHIIVNSADQYVGTVTSVSGTGSVNGLTLTGSVTSSGSLTLGGTLTGVSLTTQVTGTLPVTSGGTGQTTQAAAFDALAPSTTKGDLIVDNGTNNVRLPVGTNDFVLTADSAAATGVAWKAGANVPEIKTPTNVSPASGATNIGPTPTLTGSTFYSLYGVAMAAAQWQVSTVSNFASTVVDTGDVAGTEVTYNVSSGVLNPNTTYYWRARYKDANGVYSAWSTATSFATATSFGPTTIGEAYGGGFYAGKIVQGGTTYFLIVAPKSSGENSSKQWKTTADAGPTATQTLNNGPAASAAMNSASYPAAQFCEGLSIGGYTDWYLPSRDELELCYRNLKPTTAANSTSGRSKSSITYPEGNDTSGDTMGINRNSSPTGAAYTASVPGQTSVTAFKSGGSEAFAAGYYWSSSEYSATVAWLQYFDNGNQDYNSKSGSVYVRAVRRVAV